MKKVVLVTGGARGIGKTIVETFLKQDYAVAINYNSSVDRAKKFEKELAKSKYEYMFIRADVSDDVQVKNMIESVVNKFGKIDILINNAAVTNDSMFQDKTSETFRKVLDTNLVGAFNVSKMVGDKMFAQKSGKIINISSTNGINTYYPMCLEYDASKAGLISLTHNLAIQFAPYVSVNAVAPGFIATESELSGMDEEILKMESEKVFLKRAGTEQEVANLIRFLASDEASYINNEVIRIDGGLYGN